MKFLVDAQLPRRLALTLAAAGHDVLHTLDLPDGNATPDSQVNAISVREQRVVVTKDADFVSSLLVTQQPHKLLLVSTGNISNRELEALLVPQLMKIVDAFEEHTYVELNRTALIVHR